jgi:predicted nucleic acid-binding protein
VTPWPPVAVFDANVLYSALLRDILLRLAAADLISPRWSERIHDEWTRNLLQDRPDLSPERVIRTRAKMDEAFPEALVRGYEHLIERVTLPDPDDRHVLAAAVHAGAGVIVTRNLSDFPLTMLEPWHVEALSPDAFASRLLDEDAETVAITLERHRAGLRQPPMSPAEYYAALGRAGLPHMARRLAELQMGILGRSKGGYPTGRAAGRTRAYARCSPPRPHRAGAPVSVAAEPAQC